MPMRRRQGAKGRAVGFSWDSFGWGCDKAVDFKGFEAA
jgi:hypothetical protein